MGSEHPSPPPTLCCQTRKEQLVFSSPGQLQDTNGAAQPGFMDAAV